MLIHELACRGVVIAVGNLPDALIVRKQGIFSAYLLWGGHV
jgi:hypothetical protein